MRRIIILMLVINTFLSCTERSPQIISKDLPQSIQLIADNVENEYTQNKPLPIFDANAPSNMILSLQEEMELWINQNNIQIENQVLDFNGIGLYRNPNIQEIFPRRTAWGIGMFAMGRFLTISEKNLLYEAVYYSIPLNIREERSPFRSFEIFKNSLVFNPGVLFNDLKDVF